MIRICTIAVFLFLTASALQSKLRSLEAKSNQTIIKLYGVGTQGHNTLSWSKAILETNYEYKLEKSLDGKSDWEKIELNATLKDKGDMVQFQDLKPNSKAHYRISGLIGNSTIFSNQIEIIPVGIIAENKGKA